jgi:hypothetical protein
MLKADNFTVYCEPIVHKIKELPNLTTLQAITNSYRNSFIFFTLQYSKIRVKASRNTSVYVDV